MTTIGRCALVAVVVIALARGALAQEIRDRPAGTWARLTERTKSMLGRGEKGDDRTGESAVRRASYQEPVVAAPGAKTPASKPSQGRKPRSWFSRTPPPPSRTVSQYMAEEKP